MAGKIAHVGIEEMQAINRARLKNLGAVLDHVGPTWTSQFRGDIGPEDPATTKEDLR